MPITRRLFVTASTFLPAVRRLPAADPALRFPAAPRERLAIASYSLRTLLGNERRRSGAAMDIKDFPAFVVRRFNVRNVELLGQHLPSTEAAYLEDYRRSPGARRSEGW